MNVKHFDVKSPVDKVEKILNFLCLEWATEDEINHSFLFDLTISDTVNIRESNGLVPFSSVRSVYQIVQSNVSVSSILSELTCRAHHF